MLKSLPTLFRRALPAVLAATLLWLAPAAAAEVPYGQGLLWRVEKDGGPANWVLGTFHSTDARLRALPPAVDTALSQSRLAAFELIESPAGVEKMSIAMQLPADRRLVDILGPALFRRTLDVVAPLGVPVEALQRLKPWALSLFLLAPPMERLRLAQGEPAFDNWLQAEARRRGKTIAALETHEEQIAVFDGMTEAEQVAMVTDMLADYARMATQYNRMFRSYLNGNTALLMEEANDVSGVSDQAAAQRFKQRLIDDRNRIMAARILPLLRDGGAFVAIGAAHLPGEEGVLARLAERGYRVTREY